MKNRISQFQSTRGRLVHSCRLTPGGDSGRASLGKILVPIDFTAESRKAFQYATQLARRYGARISLVHVVEPIVFQADYGYGPVVRRVPNQEAIKRAKTRLQRFGEEIIGTRWLADCVVRSGIAFFEIAEAARLTKSDLIIIGAHGHTGFERPDLSGTAEKIIRHAPCPVLVVHRKEHEFTL